MPAEETWGKRFRSVAGIGAARSEAVRQMATTLALIMALALLMSFLGRPSQRQYLAPLLSLLALAAATVAGFMVGRQRGRVSLREKDHRLDEQRAELEQARRNRAELEKMAATGRIAARVAHEINNPLSGIKNAIYLIKDSIPPDDENHEFIDMADREIERISDIVRQMYLLYRPETQTPQPLNVPHILREIQIIMDRPLSQKRLSAQVDLPDNLPAAHGMEGYFRQIMINLITNAIQASPEHGRLWIGGRAVNGSVHVSVKDEGPGVAPEMTEHIFEPFYTTKREPRDGGMGLGLAVSRSLATAMGGAIHVDSTPGQGACFTLSLPAPLE